MVSLFPILCETQNVGRILGGPIYWDNPPPLKKIPPDYWSWSGHSIYFLCLETNCIARFSDDFPLIYDLPIYPQWFRLQQSTILEWVGVYLMQVNILWIKLLLDGNSLHKRLGETWESDQCKYGWPYLDITLRSSDFLFFSLFMLPLVFDSNMIKIPYFD